MKRGDYVQFEVNGDWLFGRVASVPDDEHAFVCFNEGCTASRCSQSDLEVIEPHAGLKAIGFGFHRFDDYCPHFDPECCFYACPEKAGGHGESE